MRPGQQEEMASMTTWVAPGSDGARSQGSLDLDVRISVWLQRYVHGSDGQMPPARRWRRDAGRPGCWQETEMAEDGGLTEMQVMAASRAARAKTRLAPQQEQQAEVPGAADAEKWKLLQ